METAVRVLAEALGKSVSDDPYAVGAWRINHNPIYGGAVIEEVVDESGSVIRPFGERSPPREFVEKVRFAVKVLEYERKVRR